MPSPPPTIAYVALGANLGDREANIRAALDQLGRTPAVRVTKVSALLENPAVGGPDDSPPFLNAVAELETTIEPEALMRRLLEIESHLGRRRTERWGPRTIDLDLLLYGDRRIDSPGLHVPHPRMAERSFVLQPMAEIAPKVIHPVTRMSMSEMLAALRRSRGV